MMPWIYTAPPLSEEETVILRSDQAHHLTRVLRLTCGAKLVVCDGQGSTLEGRIETVGKQVRVQLQGRLNYQTEPPVRVFLAQSLLKMDKMDYVIQKTVELGAAGIIPVITSRSVRRWEAGQKTGKKMDRWQKIAEAAAAQSHRTVLPEIFAPVYLDDLREHLPEHRALLVCWEAEREGERLSSLSSSIDSKEIVILIGPEGGLEPAEVSRLCDQGGKVISLGPRILRAETAALTALALVLYEWGDLGGCRCRKSR